MNEIRAANLAQLDSRLRAFIASWPTTSARYAGRYLRSTGCNGTRSSRHTPIWMLAPIMLYLRAAPRERASLASGFLPDVIWGQYCLLLFFRMQDDVLDRQTASAAVLFAADEFLIEAERTFSACDITPAFWTFFRTAVKTTARAILEVHALQHNGGVPKSRWSAYARTARIFKVGAFAVSDRLKLAAQFRRVSCFMDHVAIIDQLIDDLRDMDEDVSEHRINAVARCLLGRRTPRRNIMARLNAAVLSTNRLDRLLAEVWAYSQEARRTLGPLMTQDARRHLDALETTIARASQRVQRVRRAVILGANT